MKKLTFDDYWDQGWNARVKGKSIDDNPYPNGGWGSDRDAWANWNSGYWTCQHEEETGHICLLKKVDENSCVENTRFFESILNEGNMTMSQIKTLRQTLSELGDEAYEKEDWRLAEIYDEAQVFCSVVLMYLRDKSETNKKKVLLFFASDDMSANTETEDYEPLSVVKDEVNLPQFNNFADYVLATLVPKLQGKPKNLPKFDSPERMVKWCISRAAKLENLTFSIEYIESDKSWAVLLDTTNEDDADYFRNRVDEQLRINTGLSSGEYSYDDVQGLGDVHLGVIQYYEWSGDEYDDLDEEVRDKYIVYCEPAKNYKMRREMDW